MCDRFYPMSTVLSYGVLASDGLHLRIDTASLFVHVSMIDMSKERSPSIPFMNDEKISSVCPSQSQAQDGIWNGNEQPPLTPTSTLPAPCNSGNATSYPHVFHE